MNTDNILLRNIKYFTHADKGILAADESINTIEKRFSFIGLINNQENRRNYRLLLANTKDLEKYIHSVILFEETFKQTDDNGRFIPNIFKERGIIPGIKIDQGLQNLNFTSEEQITAGLDTLYDRLLYYKSIDIKFAKWRNIFVIGDKTPSLSAIKLGSITLARYAFLCQSLGIIPIIEPEILMQGTHSIEKNAKISSIVLHELFHELFLQNVILEAIILKPSMILPGTNSKEKQCNVSENIAKHTINTFKNHVPSSVPTINFLSGGQTPKQAIKNLNAINKLGKQPWILSFSYGRALQQDCLNIWRGNKKNVEFAQYSLLEHARLSALACLGKL